MNTKPPLDYPRLTSDSSSLGNKTETTTDTSSATHPNEPGTVTADSKVEPALEDPALADKSVTKDEKVNPAVEHETVKKEHERQEETVVDKERHQHHYHTTVQPLEDKEVLPTQVNQETAATEVREVDHDDGKNVKADVDARNAEFESTKEVEESEKVTKTETEGGEQVHHHLHETIQPVIEEGECHFGFDRAFHTNLLF